MIREGAKPVYTVSQTTNGIHRGPGLSPFGDVKVFFDQPSQGYIALVSRGQLDLLFKAKRDGSGVYTILTPEPQVVAKVEVESQTLNGRWSGYKNALGTNESVTRAIERLFFLGSVGSIIFRNSDLYEIGYIEIRADGALAAAMKNPMAMARLIPALP